MSNVLDKLNDNENPQLAAFHWFLRTDDGEVYGPVTMDVMRDWAEQSRIAPGNEISPDGETWTGAETVPELKMDWMAEMPDGRTYGPFNVLAVPNLYDNGSIPINATLAHKHTGKKVLVADILHPDSREEDEGKPALQKAKEKKWENLYKEERKIRLEIEAALQNDIDRLKDQLAQAEDDLTTAKESAYREDQELKQRDRDSNSTEQKLSSSITNLESRVKEHESAESHLKDEIAKQAKAFEAERSSLEGAAETARSEAAALNRRINSLSSDLQAREELLAETKSALNDGAKQWALRETEFQAELAHLKSIAEHTAKDAEDRIERIHTELQTQKALHAEYAQGITAEEEELVNKAAQARAQVVALEQELAAERRNRDASAEQARRKEQELTAKIAEIAAEAEASRTTIDQLRADVAEYREQALSQEAHSEALTKEHEGTRSQLQQLTEHYEQLKRESERQLEELDSQSEHFSEDKEGLRKANLQLEEEQVRLNALVDQLNDDLADAAALTAALQEKVELSGGELHDFKQKAKAEAEILKGRIAELEGRLSVANDSLERSSGSLTDKSAQMELFRKQAQEAQEKLNQEIHELQQKLRVQKENSDSELARARLKSEELESKLARAESDVKADTSLLSQTRDRISELEHELEIRESSFTSDRKRLESDLAETRRALSDASTRASELEAKIEKDSSGLQAATAQLREELTAARTEKERSAAAAAREIADLSGRLEEETEAAESLRRQLAERSGEAAGLGERLSRSEAEAARLTEKLTAAGETIKRLEENGRNLQVSYSAEKEGLATREQNLKDEVRLLKARIEELDTQLASSTSETASLKTIAEELEADSNNLRQQLASSSEDHARSKQALETDAEELRNAISEREASCGQLADELEHTKQQLQETETQRQKLEADYRQLVEDSERGEKALREQVSASSEKLTELREASDGQIADLHEESNQLKDQLEAALADNTELTDRLDDALSRLKSTAKDAVRQKRDLEAQVESLKSRLEKKSENIAQLSADLSKSRSESSNSDHSLRSTLRMLEKREIAGRKNLQKLEADLRELEDAKSVLTRENTGLVEELKDAAVQIKNLKKQVGPLTRKVSEQEELLKKRFAKPAEGNASATDGSLRLRVETIKLRVGKALSVFASVPSEKRVAALIGIALLLLLSVGGVKQLFRAPAPTEEKQDRRTEQKLQDEIDQYLADVRPEPGLEPAAAPIAVAEEEKVQAWPGLSHKSIVAEYGDYECTITFPSGLFSSGTEMTDSGIAAIREIRADYGADLKPYRLVIAGLSEPDSLETGGNRMADYALRLGRAEEVRKILVSDSQLNPANVLSVAGDTTKPGSKSVVISLQRAE